MRDSGVFQLSGNEKMNCEDQAVDSCNAMTKPDVDDNTTSHPVDKILPCDGLLLMDGDDGERGAATEAPDSAVLVRLKDVHAKDEDIELSTDIKALHSKNNGSIALAAVSADPVNGSSGEQQKHLSNVEEALGTKCSLGDVGDDDGDMDIGVDLSLDENGVLELQPADQVTAVSASSCDNTLISETVIELHSQVTSEESTEELPSLSPCVEAISPASTPGEGAEVKQGSKRVTFPSDEDIVSGAVEPKDPWRHGKRTFTVFRYVVVYEVVWLSHQYLWTLVKDCQILSCVPNVQAILCSLYCCSVFVQLYCMVRLFSPRWVEARALNMASVTRYMLQEKSARAQTAAVSWKAGVIQMTFDPRVLQGHSTAT